MKLKRFFKKTETVNQPVQTKKSWRSHYSVKLTIVFILLVIVGCASYGVWAFFDTYSVQSPIVVRPLLVPRHVNSIVSPLPGKKQSLNYFDLGTIADTIFQKESSSGANDGCRKLGLYNGYGFRQNSKEWMCYGSYGEVRTLVINWLEDNIKSGNIKEALCYYNRGIRTGDCSYAIAY